MARRRQIGTRIGSAITARPDVPDKAVKSAARVVYILEFFDDLQREATVMEVADVLGYPQSSTSALLRSLAALGYLQHDPVARTYVTSSRVALLGSWVNTTFIREGSVLQLMKRLNQQTGDTVMLAVRNGLECQYIHVVQATSPARLHVTLGSVRPLAASGTGYAMLSTMTDKEIMRLLHRINAESPPEKVIRNTELLPKIAEVRKQGYACASNIVTKGGCVIAAPLPRLRNQPQLVVGIGGITEVMLARKDDLVAMLKAGIAAYAQAINEETALAGALSG